MAYRDLYGLGLAPFAAFGAFASGGVGRQEEVIPERTHSTAVIQDSEIRAEQGLGVMLPETFLHRLCEGRRLKQGPDGASDDGTDVIGPW